MYWVNLAEAGTRHTCIVHEKVEITRSGHIFGTNNSASGRGTVISGTIHEDTGIRFLLNHTFTWVVVVVCHLCTLGTLGSKYCHDSNEILME